LTKSTITNNLWDYNMFDNPNFHIINIYIIYKKNSMTTNRGGANIIVSHFGWLCSQKRDFLFPIKKQVLPPYQYLITIILLAVGAPLTIANLFYNNLIIDYFTYFFQIFLLLSTTSTIVMCLDYFKAVYKLFSVSHIIFHELAYKGSLIGINKSCW
jgi:hypothetical protein